MGNICPICKKAGIELIIKRKKFFCPNCFNEFPAVEKGGFYRIRIV